MNLIRCNRWILVGLMSLLCVCGTAGSLALGDDRPKGGAAPSSLPGVAAETSTISAAEAKIWLKEFARAQSIEWKSLEHRKQFELKVMKASQDARFKAWKNQESQGRHQFFKEHVKGAERRDYVHDYLRRQEQLLKDIGLEKAHVNQDLDLKLTELKSRQSDRLTEVKKLLDQGQRPGLAVWPLEGPAAPSLK